jgi:hypothetical protein
MALASDSDSAATARPGNAEPHTKQYIKQASGQGKQVSKQAGKHACMQSAMIPTQPQPHAHSVPQNSKKVPATTYTDDAGRDARSETVAPPGSSPCSTAD